MWSRVPPRLRRPLLVAAALLGLVLVAAVWRSGGGDRSAAPPTGPTATPVAGAFGDCQQCHGNLDRQFRTGVAADGLRFSHAIHFTKAIGDCAQCHPADTHQQDATLTPTMDRCYQCHGTGKQAVASGRCTTCHTGGSLPEPDSHAVAGWADGAHAALARADRSSCLTCHEEKSFCGTCHGPDGAKPASHAIAGWATGAHRQLATQDRAACLTCHSEQGFCQPCHARNRPANHAIPGWAQGAHEEIAEHGRGTCLTCHATSFCQRCHAAHDD